MNIFKQSGRLLDLAKIANSPEILQYVIETTAFLPQDVDLRERLAYIKEGRTEIKKCPYCENRCSMRKRGYGLTETCSSQSCRNKYSGAGVSKRWATYDFTQRNEKLYSEEDLCKNLYRSLIYNSKKLETIQTFIRR